MALESACAGCTGATRCGVAAAPRGVENCLVEWGDQAGYNVSGVMGSNRDQRARKA